MTIGTLVAFTALQAGLFRPITGLLNVGVSLVSSLALFARIFEYLDLPVEVDDPEHPVDVDPARVRGHVRIDDVTFAYPGSDTAAVAGVTLDVPAGTSLALVGETGSGKSTLAALITRLHDPDAGRITIDGIDLRDLRLADLARIVGVVSQETYLLHTTVRENLRYARPDATDAEIEAAARAAQIHDLIAGLPEGYDTLVGSRGHRFSGGEKPAHRDRPHAAARPAGARARRGDERPRHRDRARRAAGLRRAGPGPDDDHHRPPALDGAGRGPDRGAGPRPDRRVGHARGLVAERGRYATLAA